MLCRRVPIALTSSEGVFWTSGFHEFQTLREGPAQAPLVSAPAPEETTPNVAAKPKGMPTAELQGLSFKVGPVFRKRFRQRSTAADLKLNELLLAALDAWEEKVGFWE